MTGGFVVGCPIGHALSPATRCLGLHLAIGLDLNVVRLRWEHRRYIYVTIWIVRNGVALSISFSKLCNGLRSGVRGGVVGEYEEKQKNVSEAYDKYREEFYRPGSGTGDQKRAEKNREMQQATENLTGALREAHAVAPSVSERAQTAEAIGRYEAEAREFGERADHYENKRNES